MTVLLAISMAVVGAVLFAVAAVVQNGAVAAVVDPGALPVVGGAELRELVRSRIWLGSAGLTAAASILHAGALVLASVGWP
jgi:hypothetical protein